MDGNKINEQIPSMQSEQVTFALDTGSLAADAVMLFNQGFGQSNHDNIAGNTKHNTSDSEPNAATSAPTFMVLQELQARSEMNSSKLSLPGPTIQSDVLDEKTQFPSSNVPLIIKPQNDNLPSLGSTPQSDNLPSLASTAELNSDYLIVVENPDGSQTLSRLITGPDRNQIMPQNIFFNPNVLSADVQLNSTQMIATDVSEDGGNPDHNVTLALPVHMDTMDCDGSEEAEVKSVNYNQNEDRLPTIAEQQLQPATNDPSDHVYYLDSLEEEKRQKKILKEQRKLMQSHLQHHIQQSRKKHLAENPRSPQSDDKWKDAGLSDDTPIFTEITAELNRQLYEKIPGCQKFLLDLSNDNPESIRFDDEAWSFQGDMKTLILLFNSLKSFIQPRSKTLVRFQTFENSPESNTSKHFPTAKNEKSINCNLLMPYITSRGRELKQTNKMSSSDYFDLSDSVLDILGNHQNENDEEFSQTAQSNRKGRKQAKPKRVQKYLSKRFSKHSANSELSSRIKTTSKEILKCGEETSSTLQSESSCNKPDFSGNDDPDPLMKKLHEEQIKYQKQKEKKMKSESLDLGLELVSEYDKTENDMFDSAEPVSGSSVQSSSADAPSEQKLPAKRRGRPPKKYDHFVKIEKVKPRNPLTESARTKQKRNYEEQVAFKFFCEKCSFKTKRESHFLSHLQCHKDDGSEQLYTCKVCSFTSISHVMLQRHELKHKKMVYKCKVCAAYTTDRPALLQKHMRLKHCDSSKLDVNCQLCSFSCQSLQGLARHMTTKHPQSDGVKPSKEKALRECVCHICQKPFKSVQHLHRHIRDIHEEPNLRPYLCDTCGKAFKRTDALQQHRYVHMGRSARVMPFKCATCSKAFRSAAHLKEHQAMHTTERPFLCQYCGAAFKTEPVRKKHVQTLHTKPKTQNVCQICGRQFNSKNALQRHEATHSKANNTLSVDKGRVSVLCLDTTSEAAMATLTLQKNLEQAADKEGLKMETLDNGKHEAMRLQQMVLGRSDLHTVKLEGLGLQQTELGDGLEDNEVVADDERRLSQSSPMTMAEEAMTVSEEANSSLVQELIAAASGDTQGHLNLFLNFEPN